MPYGLQVLRRFSQGLDEGAAMRNPSSSWCLRLLATAIPLLTPWLITSPANAQNAQSFYAGKILKLIVGLPPGGGADAYARLVQRHLARHIPGAPTVVIQNMPGAG